MEGQKWGSLNDSDIRKGQLGREVAFSHPFREHLPGACNCYSLRFGLVYAQLSKSQSLYWAQVVFP